ncbi:MAG: hypothetical protein JXR68_02525 [Bacteroidales bacterium]|nr:hypothetical protein [Bacteroidales bacterium]
MKRILTIIFLIVVSLNVFAQWEFNYFVLKVGANHHMFSPQPKGTSTMYVNTPDGEYRLEPDSTFISDYVPGFQVGLNFHFDFSNDMGGIIIGAEFQNKGISAKYLTISKEYNLLQTHRVNSISVPFFVKLGKEIFDQQRYIFGGVRFNVNFGLLTIDKVNWITEPRMSYSKDKFFVNNNINFALGVNFLIFNVEFNFYPDTFLDKLYSQNVGTENDPFWVKTFENQPDKLMFLQTSIYIPISSWTTSKSYFMHKIFRRL